MNKTDLAYGMALFVLAAGLSSCSKEQTTKDIYKSPPPVVVTQKGNQKLMEWDRTSDKTLDLQDSFDVSAGNPAKVFITAFCAREKINVVQAFNPSGRRPIKIFQILPQELLSDDLSKISVTCEWEVSLFNEAGSRHVIRISSAPIADRGAAEVLIEGATPTDAATSLHIHKANAFKIRYRNQEAAAAEILCRDVTFDAVAFEKVLDFNSFDLRRPRLRENKSALGVRERPLQPCRIAVNEGGALRQISALVNVQIPRKALQITVAPLLPKMTRTFVMNIQTGAAFAQVTVKNTEPAPRLVRINKMQMLKLDAVVTEINASKKFEGRSTMNLPWLEVRPAQGFLPVKEDATSWTIKLPPQSEVTLHTVFRRVIPGCFRQFNEFTRYIVQPHPLTITEISEKDEAIDTTQTPLPENWVETTPEQLQTYPPFPRACI